MQVKQSVRVGGHKMHRLSGTSLSLLLWEDNHPTQRSQVFPVRHTHVKCSLMFPQSHGRVPVSPTPEREIDLPGVGGQGGARLRGRRRNGIGVSGNGHDRAEVQSSKRTRSCGAWCSGRPGTPHPSSHPHRGPRREAARWTASHHGQSPTHCRWLRRLDCAGPAAPRH